MPIYEYQCKACGASFDIVQKMNDAPLKKCPDCQKSQLTKLISAPSFQLKGTGWYETDFKTKPKKEEVKHDKSEAKTETKVDAKTEAKTDTKKESASTKKD